MCTYFVHTSVTSADSSRRQQASTITPRKGNTKLTESKRAPSNISVRPVSVNRPVSWHDCAGFLKSTWSPVLTRLFQQSVKNIFNAASRITFTALRVLLHPDLVLIARVFLISSTHIIQNHSFSNGLTPRDRFCKGSNLKKTYTSTPWWIPTNGNLTTTRSTGSADISSKNSVCFFFTSFIWAIFGRSASIYFWHLLGASEKRARFTLLTSQKKLDIAVRYTRSTLKK